MLNNHRSAACAMPLRSLLPGAATFLHTVVIFFLFTVLSAQAAGGLPARQFLSVGAGGRLPGIPFVTVAWHTGDVSLVGELGAARHELFGAGADSRLALGLLRYRSPIAWRGWAPTADAGVLFLRSDASGLAVGVTGFTAALGAEARLGEDSGWHVRGELRAARLLDETRWLLGFGLEHRFGLTGGVRGDVGPVARRSGPEASAAPSAPGAAVRAEGRITGTSLPISVSGTWSFYADPARGAAEFSAQGAADGEAGAVGFSQPIRVRADGTSATAVFVERGEHEGKDARAEITVSVSPAGLSVHVAAYRADGLSVSADLYGATDFFEAEPLTEAGATP